MLKYHNQWHELGYWLYSRLVSELAAESSFTSICVLWMFPDTFFLHSPAFAVGLFLQPPLQTAEQRVRGQLGRRLCCCVLRQLRSEHAVQPAPRFRLSAFPLRIRGSLLGQLQCLRCSARPFGGSGSSFSRVTHFGGNRAASAALIRQRRMSATQCECLETAARTSGRSKG